MLKKKLNILILSVRELQNIYRFKHDPTIFTVVSNRTCHDTNDKAVFWKYFIRFDLLDSPKDIIRGFIHLFIKNSRLLNLNESYDKYEKELVNFCYIMHQLGDAMPIKLDDKREIEKDYNLKLELPPSVVKWQIKEAVVNRPSTAKKADSEGIAEAKTVSTFSKKNNEEGDGMTKRQRMLIYDQLSSDQINMPTNNVTHYLQHSFAQPRELHSTNSSSNKPKSITRPSSSNPIFINKSSSFSVGVITFCNINLRVYEFFNLYSTFKLKKDPSTNLISNSQIF